MKSLNYQIAINMRVPGGYTEIGRFFTGPDKETVYSIFGQLQGTRLLVGSAILRIDVIEQDENLATILETLDCTLAEMAENVKIILKETFRLLNLK